MPLFSERYGYKSPRDVLQYECINDNLRMSIYNALYSFFGEYSSQSSQENICKQIWSELWHNPLDEFPSSYAYMYPNLKVKLLECKWFELYDLIEFIAQWFKQQNFLTSYFEYGGHYNDIKVSLEDYSETINDVLEREGACYRLIDGYIESLTNEQEISEIEDSLKLPDRFSGAKDHIEKALRQFAKRPESDYCNTIKEAMLAVESIAKTLADADKGTLSNALDTLKTDFDIHPALINGWKNLYGFSSDEDGIRHASYSDKSNVDFALTKYFLVSCSAFVNYLAELPVD